MYHKKKEMDMGGRMEMGHGGDMEKAVKIYLMKKGGKTAFPDLTGDGKVTFADVLKGRLKKSKKKSMDDGGYVYRYRSPAYRMAPMEMRSIDVGGNPASAGRLQKDFRDQIYDMFDAADMGLRSEPTRADIDAIDRIPNRSKDMALADREYVGGLKEQPFIERKEDILRERDLRGLMDPMRLNLPEDMRPMQSRKPGEIMGYGGKVKMLKGGKVEYGMGGKTMEYGLGGAVMGGLNALMQGRGLAGAAGAAAKGFVTPGSGIAQGAQLAGNLAQKSNNPMLQNIGKMAGVASNFLPGGNPMGALGNLAGMLQARGGMMVPPKMRLLRR